MNLISSFFQLLYITEISEQFNNYFIDNITEIATNIPKYGYFEDILEHVQHANDILEFLTYLSVSYEKL